MFLKSNGLTLLEILIVVGIIAVLTSLSLPLGLDFYRSQQLEAQSQEIVQTLRRAQLKAMSVEDDSSFGVYFTDDNYTLFKGGSYTTRETQHDEVFNLPLILTLNGLSEVVFSKLEGVLEGNSAYCQGTCAPCSDFLDRKSCNKQDGCSWITKDKVCAGICTLCDSYQDQVECENQLSCSWYPSARGGDIILNSNGNYRVININEVGRVNLGF